MPKVKNLNIELQNNSSQYFASWEFDQETRNTVSTSSVQSGDLVTIKAGATWYNGAAIPDWVMSDRWYVLEIAGDRAVLDQNQSYTNSIMSPINISYLIGGTGGGTTSTTTTDPSTLDHYTVHWWYNTGNIPWFDGGSSDVEITNALYSPPDNAIKTKVVVTPVAKTYKVDDQDVYYWTGTATEFIREKEADPPDKPSSPTVTLDKYTITAELDKITNARYDKIQFDVIDVSDGGEKHVASGKVTVKLANATFVTTVSAGGKYRVRCRAINLNATSNNAEIYSEWSDLADPVSTVPNPTTGITVCKATSSTEVHAEWAGVSSATAYELEYTTEPRYFDASDQTTSVTDIKQTHYEVAGLETGKEYFFRVRATNDSGESAWCSPVSVVVGKVPTAPTTWASTTTATVGESVTLFWVHNAQDNSSQTYADLELVINGVKETHTIKNTEDEDLKDKTSSYIFDTSKYSEGTTVLWRVRTAGVTKEYGEWSVQRQINVYAPVTLSLNLTDQNGNAISSITQFPFYLTAFAGPKNQEPVGYHVSIKANSSYTTSDIYGNDIIIHEDEEVYSKYFDTSNQLVVEFTPININLKDGISYTISCIVAMNSGLTKESTTEFSVSWTEMLYEPDAEIGIDKENWVAYIRPYCVGSNSQPITDIYLGIYRRNYDGEFIEIESGIDGSSTVYITDPHPALDYARYRITATSKTTGVINYYDVPNYPVGCKSIVIQWNDTWTNFEANDGNSMEVSPWGGTMFTIPYNVDISDETDVDVSLVEYIGRDHPVSYYGTQKGFTSSWSFDMPKEDTERLSLIRRLQVYMGDCYVREPSGTGYWAQVKVSYNRDHNSMIIPVTLDITRVEGGK